MNLSNFVAYVKQAWKNKPDTSTPLSAERLTHQEEGIKGNSDAIQELAAAVVSQIVNDPNKIASMAALYAANQKIGDTSKLPAGTTDVASAIAQLYSNIEDYIHIHGTVVATNLTLEKFKGKMLEYTHPDIPGYKFLKILGVKGNGEVGLLGNVDSNWVYNCTDTQKTWASVTVYALYIKNT